MTWPFSQKIFFCFNPCDKLVLPYLVCSPLHVYTTSVPYVWLMTFPSIYFTVLALPISGSASCLCLRGDEMSILFIIVKRQECSSAGGGRQLINLLRCNELSRLSKQPRRESVCVYVCACLCIHVLCWSVWLLLSIVRQGMCLLAREIYKKKVTRLVLLLLSDCVDIDYKLTFNVNFKTFGFGYLFTSTAKWTSPFLDTGLY